MRKIGIRQFQRNLYEEIKDLPLIVTRRGRVIFRIYPPTKINAVETVQRVKASKY